MKLANKLLIINILLLIAVWATSCKDEDLEEILKPEVIVKVTAVEIDIASNSVPQCLNKVYDLKATFTDDSRRSLTPQEIVDYVEWDISSDIVSALDEVPFSSALAWSCYDYDATPDEFSDPPSDPTNDIKWRRVLNRIRFDSQGTARINLSYKDQYVGPFYASRDITIDAPKLTSVKVIVDPSKNSQLRGDENVASGSIFSDDGVCERVVYKEGELVVGCVKQFLAEGLYDSDETRDISQHERVRWLIDPTNDITSDSTPDYPAGFLNQGVMELDSYPADNPYPNLRDWTSKCKEPDQDTTDNVTEYWVSYGCPYSPGEWKNKNQYETTFNYLISEPEATADKLINRKGLAFGLLDGFSFKAEATMDGVSGSSPDIGVVSKTISHTKIFTPPKHVSTDNADFIEELRIQLKSVGVYNNDTSIDTTEQVNWSTLNTDYFIVNYLSRGAIYGEPFPRDDPTTDRMGEITASGIGDPVTMSLRVERKKLYSVYMEIDPGVDRESDGVVQFDLNETDVPAKAWAIFNNYDGVTNEYQTNNLIGKVNISGDMSADWTVGDGSLVSVDSSGDAQKVKIATKNKQGDSWVKVSYKHHSQDPSADTKTVRISNKTEILEKIRIIPSAIRFVEGESVRLRAWGIYSNKVVRELIDQHVVWESSGDRLVIPGPAKKEASQDSSDTTSIIVTALDVTSSADPDAAFKVIARFSHLGKTHESTTDITIDDVQLKGFEVSASKNWLTDITGDTATLNILGTFVGFIDNTDPAYISCNDITSDSTDSVAYICSRFLNNNEVNISYDNNYIDIAYDSLNNVFRVTPKSFGSDVTVDITVDVIESALGPPVNTQIRELEKQKTSLKIYNIPTVEFQAGNSSADEGETAKIPIKLSHAANQDIFVFFKFQNGDPSASGDGVDYDDTISRSVVIPLGETTADISFGITDDKRNEHVEKVGLNILRAEMINAGELVSVGLGAATSHMLSIHDNTNDVSRVSFASSLDRWVNETDSSYDIEVHVKLSEPSDRDATVLYSFNPGGTATSDDYFDVSGGEARFKAGETEAFFVIKIKGNPQHEIDETLIIDLIADPGWNGNFELAAPVSHTIRIIDNDSLNISVDATNGYAEFDATNITNTGSYYFQPKIEATQEDATFSAYNIPDWATFDTSTGVLRSKTNRPSKDEVGTHPSSSEIVICVKDKTDSTGSETDCLTPFKINVRTCKSFADGDINQSSIFNRDRYGVGGDSNCGGAENHVTVIDHTVDWSSSFAGIIEVTGDGVLGINGVSSDSAEIRLYGGALEVTSASTLNGLLRVSGDATIKVNNGVALTYNGPAVNIGDHTLDVAGVVLFDPSSGLVLDNPGGMLRLAGGRVTKVDVSGDGAKIDAPADSTIDSLTVLASNTLNLSGSGHLKTNAGVMVGGKIKAAHNGRLSGMIAGVGELDISGDSLTLGGDLTIDINILTTNSDTTLDTVGYRLDWDGKDGAQTLKGRVFVDGGVFRLIDGSADIQAAIELNSGRLEAWRSAEINGNISLTPSSASFVDVSSGAALVYRGNDIYVSNNTLILEGYGSIEDGNSLDLFTIQPGGTLRIDESPQLLDSIRLSGGLLEINNTCDISHNFHLDATSSTIQINIGSILNYTADASLDISVDSLLLTGPGRLSNVKNFVLTGNGILRLDGSGTLDNLESNSGSAEIRAEGAYTIKSLKIAADETADIKLDALGSLTIDGAFELTADRTLAISSGSSSDRKIDFKTGLTFAGGTFDINQNVEISGDINMTAASVLDVSSDKELSYTGSSFNIGKTLSLKGGGDVSNDSPLVVASDGVLSIEEASSDILKVIELSGGSLSINYSTTISGSIIKTAGFESTIDVASTRIFNYAGNPIDISSETLSLAGDGTIDTPGNFVVVSGSGVVSIVQNMDISGDITLNGGTLKVLANPDIYGNIIQQDDASVEVSGVLTYHGDLWNVGGNILSLTGEGDIVNNGKLVLNNSEGRLILDGNEASMDYLKVEADISIDAKRNFTLSFFDMLEDVTIDIENAQIVTIDSNLVVPSNRSLCVTGLGDLQINGRLTLEGTLCPSNNSGWAATDVLFNGGSISNRGDSDSWTYSAQGNLTGKTDLRGVTLTLIGNLNIASLDLTTDASTIIATGPHTLTWDGGGILKGRVDVGPGTFEVAGGLGEAIIDASIDLNGGVWRVSQNTAMNGNLSLNADSSIDVVSPKKLTYAGDPMNIGISRLSLIGGGIIDNSTDAGHSFVLNDPSGKLELDGAGGKISRVDVSDDLADGRIIVGANFTVGHLEQSGHVKIDIDDAAMLTINDALKLDSATDILSFVSASGDGDVSFDNGLTLSGGKLDVLQDLDIFGDIEVTGDVVSTVTVDVNNNLTHNSHSGGPPLTAIKVGKNSILSLGGPIPFEIELAGGTLAVESSADLSGRLTHTASSDINIYSNAFFNYTSDVSFDIGSLTLSLSGGGSVSSDSAAIRLDQPDSVLSLSGAGGVIDRVDISASLTDGRIKADADFTIGVLNKLPDKTTIIDIASGAKLTAGNFSLESGEILKFASLAGGGDSTFDGNLTLNGGELIIDQDLTISADIEQSATSDINVTSLNTLTYSGADLLIGDYTLYLSGSGRIDNSSGSAFVLNNPAGLLALTGGDGTVDYITVNTGAPAGYRPVETRENFTIETLTLNEDASIDILAAKTLTISGALNIPDNVDLKVTGDGTLDINGDSVTLSGVSSFERSGGLSQSFDISSVSSSTVVIVNGDYSLRGNLTGDVNLSGAKIELYGDLNINADTLTTNSTTNISTDVNTLTWNGKSLLNGSVTVGDGSDNGFFKVDGSVGTIYADVYLNGGTLDIDVNTGLNGNLYHIYSSFIDVSQDATLTYRGRSLDIETWTLSLNGAGDISNVSDDSAYASFQLNEDGSVLKCYGNGAISNVRVTQDSKSGRFLDIDGDFSVGQFDISADLAVIDISSGAELTVNNDLNVATGDALKFTSLTTGFGKLTLASGLLLSGGLLQVDQSLDVSGDFKQNADSTIDIFPGDFLGYQGAPLDISNDVTLNLSGDSSLDVSLDGAVLRVDGSSDLYGNITHTADSSIDISANKILTYRGASVDVNNTLCFTGTGRFENTPGSELILNQDSSKLKLEGTFARIGRLKASDDNTGDQIAFDIEVLDNAVIDYFDMTQDVSIDIASGKTLTVSGGFTVPSGKGLFVTGEGGTFQAIDNPVILNGVLRTAHRGTLEMDISMDADATFDRKDVASSESDMNIYRLKGTLAGRINLSGSKLSLLDDLTFDNIGHLNSSFSLFSVEDHTLDWRVTNLIIPYLDASVDISADGVFRASEDLIFGNDAFLSPYLKLSGGRLEINSDSTIDRLILHEVSSDIRVDEGVSLYIDSDLKIGARALSLSGKGDVLGFAWIALNNPASVLNLTGNGEAKKVRVDQSLTTGRLRVSNGVTFTIADLSMDNLSAANINIDVSSDSTLDIQVIVGNDNSLKFINNGVVDGNLSLNNGKLDVSADSTLAGNIILEGDASVDLFGEKTLYYNGAAVYIGKHDLTINGDGGFDNNNNNHLTLDHKDSKLYLKNSAFVRLIKITGDLKGDGLTDVYVEDDASIDTFVMEQDSNFYIAAGKTLTIENGFSIPKDKRLIITGGGHLVVNGIIDFDDGRLLPSGVSSFYSDQSGDIYMAGVWEGSKNLGGHNLILAGDLTLDPDSSITNAADISTGAHTLNWDGQSVLKGKINVREGGRLKITGSGSVNDATIDLSGGTLDIDQDLTLDSNSTINVLGNSSIDVAAGVILTYNGHDISTGAYTLSLTGPGFLYNGKDGSGSYIAINHSSGVLRLTGDNGIVNKVRVDASGDILAENDFVIMRLLLNASPLGVDVASDKILIIGEELTVESDSTIDIAGAGTLLLHDVVMNANLEFNKSGTAKLELAPDATLKVLSASALLAPGMDLEFDDGLYIGSAADLTIVDADGTYTVTFGGGAIIDGVGITLDGDESLVFNYPVDETNVLALVTNNGSGSVSPNPDTSSDPLKVQDVVEFTAVAGDKTVYLSWSYQDDATQVKICRHSTSPDYDSTSDCDGTTEITLYSGSNTSSQDINLSNGVRYYYTAFGYDGVHYSDGVQATATPTFVADGLVGYYRLDETPDSISRVSDDSTLDNEGFIFGSFEQTADMKNADKAYVFDGVNDYFEIDNPFESASNFEASADDFSLSLWLRTENANGNGANWYEGNSLITGRISRADDWADDADFGLSIGDGRVMFGTGGTGVFDPLTIKTTKPLNDGYWHNITAVRDAPKLILYVDGVEEVSADGLNGQLTLPNILGVGARPFGGELYYKGNLDEARLYSRALTYAEVKKLYARSQDIVAYYRLDGDVTDDSGFGNHGTAKNGADPTSGINVDAGSGVYSVAGAYDFNGTSAYLEVYNSGDFKPTKEISYSLWAYFPTGKGALCDTAGEEVLLSSFHSDGGYEMYCKGDKVGARIHSNDPASTTVDASCDVSGASDNDWHNITAVYEADPVPGGAADGKLAVYFDESSCELLVNIGEVNYSGSVPLIIGAGAADPGVEGYYFEGKIDEVKVYERALSAAEIETLYKTALADKPGLSRFDATSVDVSWDAVSGATIYKLYRSDAENGSYAEISSNAVSPYRDAGLSVDTAYYYKLVFCNADGCSARSNAGSITTEGSPVPGNSGVLSAGNGIGNSFTLSWTAAIDTLNQQSELQYKVVESTNDNINDATSAEANGTVVQNWTYNITSRVIGDLSLNVYYYFNVLVKDPDGNTAAYETKVVKLSFEEAQAIPTNGAFDWKFFSIDDDSYLAVANYSNDSSNNIDSRIYKWNSVDSTFDHFKDIATNGALDWEFFTIGADSYLAVANHYNGSSYSIDSSIYKWDSVDSTFDHFKDIATNGAFDLEYFTIGTDGYLAVANYFNDSSNNIDSRIYKWNSADSSFDHIQDIATNSARDLEYFTIDGDSYLAVANFYSGSSYSIDSRIYKWNSADSSFDHIQDIATNGAHDWEYFTIGSDSYLAVANHYNGSSYSIDSSIYKWDSVDSSFDHFKDIATNGAHDWEYFTIGSDSYLAVANYSSTSNIDSRIYKWNSVDSSFDHIQSIGANGAADLEYFTIDGDSYLAVANHINGSYNIDSRIYKLSLSVLP